MKSHIVISSDDVDMRVLRYVEQGVESLYVVLEFHRAAPLPLIENIT